jgi:hypothetical protein
MDKDSNLPPSQDQKKFQQEDLDNWGERGFDQGEGQGSSGSSYMPRQQKIGTEGYQEDEPGHPVRTTGSSRKDQESGSVQPGDDREGKH